MSEYYIAGIPCSAELYHHGVPDQKWGIRRYQNPDGSLTPLGRIHYGYGKAKEKVGKAARATGKGLAKAAKVTGKGIQLTAKYATLPVRRNHSWMLTKNEMRKMMERYDIESQYKRSKYAARGESLTKKMLDAAGQISYKGLETLAKKTAEKAADKIAERAFESADERAARKAKTRRQYYEDLHAGNTQRQEARNAELEDREHEIADRQRLRDLRRREFDERLAAPERRRQEREYRRNAREEVRRERAEELDQQREQRREQREQREQRAEERRQQRAEERQRNSEYSSLFDEADRRSQEDNRTPEQVAEDWGRRNAERSARDTRLANESRLRRSSDTYARQLGYESAYDRALAEMAREADQRRETRELNEIAEEALRNRRRH